jgi:hypothetical protein
LIDLPVQLAQQEGVLFQGGGGRYAQLRQEGTGQARLLTTHEQLGAEKQEQEKQGDYPLHDELLQTQNYAGPQIIALMMR